MSDMEAKNASKNASKIAPKNATGNAASTVVIALLSGTHLFGDLGADDLEACAAAFDEMRFAKGDTLFVRGDPGAHLYVVEAGRVRLSISTLNDRKLSFRHAVPGDLFGEIAALDGEPRSADATAITRVTVHGLERTKFRALWATRPAIADRVVAFLCGRLRQTTTQFESIVLLPLEVRLARFLLSALGGRVAPPGRRVALEHGFSQGELSQLLGASRPKVNQAMGLLERAGAVGRTMDRMFCDPDKLAEIARRRVEG
jgi:CRP/FNR family cyclic AMP-dependent transcriptional regulator